jgi:hypothetical protein
MCNLPSAPDSTRASSRKRPLSDVPNNLAAAPTPAAEHPIGHFAAINKKSGKNRQLGWRWYTVKENRASYTNLYCAARNIALCAPNGCHQRTCWAQHALCSSIELAKLRWRRP